MSYWSSEVCSADMADPLAHRVQRAQEVVAERPHVGVGVKGEPAGREHYRWSGRGIGIADSLAPGAEEGIAFDDRGGDTETDAVAGRGHPGASGLAQIMRGGGIAHHLDRA